MRLLKALPARSAYPPRLSLIADINSRRPRANSGREQVQQNLLLDHLVGASEDGRRNLDAQRFRYLEINEEIEFGWQHYWQFGRLFAFDDAPSIVARLAVCLRPAGAIAHEAAGFDLLAIGKNGRQGVARRQHDQFNAFREEKRVGAYDHRTNSLLFNNRESIVDLTRRAGTKQLQWLPYRFSRFLHGAPFCKARWILRVKEHRNPAFLANEFARQVQSLCRYQ